MLDQLFSHLAPHRCYNCRQLGGVLCLRCSEDISMEGFSHCLLCAHPTSGSSQLCKTCRKSSPLEDGWCIGWRQDTLKNLIDDYKFAAVKQAAGPLASLLAASLPYSNQLIVTEVPTAHSHVRRLGYDHAKLLARTLAGQRRLSYRSLLKRVGQQTQHFSGRRLRQSQAAQLFSAPKPVSGSVLLVDDIVTTGSSLMAAARVLRRSGADRVYAAVLVRQPLD